MLLASMDGGSSLIWDIASLNANLALPLARRMAISDLLVDEVRGEAARPPGERLMDAIGLRYVVARSKHRDREPYANDLREIFRDDDFHFFVLENEHARPQLSLVPGRDARWVASLDAAIGAFHSSDDVRRLVLERPGRDGASSGPSSTASSSFTELEESRADALHVIVEATEPVYLVVADAPYEGWRAEVDGEPSPVIAANVLAKAIAIPAGRHRVRVFFEPDSFRQGVGISIATGLAMLLFLAWQRVARG